MIFPGRPREPLSTAGWYTFSQPGKPETQSACELAGKLYTLSKGDTGG